MLAMDGLVYRRRKTNNEKVIDYPGNQSTWIPRDFTLYEWLRKTFNFDYARFQLTNDRLLSFIDDLYPSVRRRPCSTSITYSVMTPGFPSGADIRSSLIKIPKPAIMAI